jgi:hypothetical protein
MMKSISEMNSEWVRAGALFPALLVLLTPNTTWADGPVDEDSKAWWALTSELSSDAMEGRDTGSGGHERAARLVAQLMAEYGLQPLGYDGSFFQRIPLEDVTVTDATLAGPGGEAIFLDDFSVSANAGLPQKNSTAIAYRGYCAAEVLGDVRGKLVICHGTSRAGLTTRHEREEAVRAADASGMVTIDDPGFTVEPPIWPAAYARSVRLAGELAEPDSFVKIYLNPDALGTLVAGRDAVALIASGAAGQPLPSFDTGLAEMTFVTRASSYSSPNVIGLLPGSDPALADQVIVLGAHLDGYGFGRAVGGDAIYNGTLDDAAYVALLLRLAQKRQGRSYARPIIFAAWTSEEKGGHGSEWFLDHPPVPLSRIAANINLDQLRPIFPLELLTVHARTDTTLGDDATAVASEMGIAVQDDPEPERNLLRRSDQWSFISAGIPAINFVFGYEPGSASESTYRQWYRTGYHRPQDDIEQLMDWQAAADFNQFFYALVDRVANQSSGPAWRKESDLRPVED